MALMDSDWVMSTLNHRPFDWETPVAHRVPVLLSMEFPSGLAPSVLDADAVQPLRDSCVDCVGVKARNSWMLQKQLPQLFTELARIFTYRAVWAANRTLVKL